MAEIKEVFSLKEIRAAIPDHLFVKSEFRFLLSVVISGGLTGLIAYLAYLYIPLNIYYLPVWLAYAYICGTVATGLWVLGHEAGHGAFSKHKILNEILGFVLHSLLLVPYFSWQWSHHVHHMKTNHVEEGEGYVPYKKSASKYLLIKKIKAIMGDESFSILQIFNILVLGWPLYLLFGASGCPEKKFSSHFIVPNGLLKTKELIIKSQISNIGLFCAFYMLYQFAQLTSFYHVLAIYIGPYMVVNAYLTGITLLQHTDKNVPHYDRTAWTWLKGALCSVDRNYHQVTDFLQHHIGTTHVLHHIFSDLPHYNAPIANIYLKQTIGKLYYQDKDDVLSALFAVGKLTCVDHEGNGVWKFI